MAGRGLAWNWWASVGNSPGRPCFGRTQYSTSSRQVLTMAVPFSGPPHSFRMRKYCSSGERAWSAILTTRSTNAGGSCEKKDWKQQSPWEGCGACETHTSSSLILSVGLLHEQAHFSHWLGSGMHMNPLGQVPSTSAVHRNFETASSYA